MSTTKKTINVTPVKEGMKKTINASYLLQTYYNVIEKTPLFAIPARVDADSHSKVVEQWPGYQKIALANAKRVFDGPDSLNAQMSTTLAGIIGFHDAKWEPFYGHLQEAIKSLSVGNNAEKVTQAMNLFQEQVKHLSTSTQPVITSLQRLLAAVEEDERNFTAANNFLTAAMTGEQGELQALEDKIDALHDAIDKDNKMIAGGAAMIAVGIVVAVVGVVAEPLTLGASTALVAGGAAVAIGGAVAVGLGEKDLSKSTKDLASSMVMLNEDKQVFGLVKNCARNITHMRSAIENAITGLESLAKGWDSLHADFGEVITAVNGIDTDPSMSLWISDELTGADKVWSDTVTLAKQLQSNGTVKIKEVKHKVAA
ncbi:MAG: HBL/NHE enterotoxin family protein [Lewinella sp.]